LILAVWVKLGGLPFHLWVRAGRRLSLSSRTWLFGTVMPNLGLYLLYRVSPLVALPGPARTVAMWLGAAGAALAALLALVQTDVRAAPAYLGAVQAGLVVFVAAGWGKEAVWLALLVLTPLRTLLFVAADTPGDKVSAGMLSLGGLALAGFGATLVWWGRAGGSAGALFVAEAAVGLVAAWAVQVTWRFMVEPWDVSRPGQVHGTRLVVLALLGAVILAGGLAFEPLAHRLAAATGQSSPVIPALPSLLEHMAVMPVALTVVVLVAALWGLQRRFKRPAFDEGSGDAYNLEEALTHAAEALRNVVEVSLLEHGLVLALRAVLGSARAAQRFVEQQGLEHGLDLVLRAVLGSARAALRFVEQQGLEGALRWFGHTVLRMSRAMQRWHNGRLRRYLLWIPITLALALLALWWPE